MKTDLEQGVDIAAYKGKRIAAFDYGLKRTGFAVSDIFHITVKPICFFETMSTGFWGNLDGVISEYNPGLIVLGMPFRLDGTETELMKKIKSFGNTLKQKYSCNVVYHDESYSTKNAVKTMIQIGKGKKQRSMKGSDDMIAAAIILQDFLKIYGN